MSTVFDTKIFLFALFAVIVIAIRDIYIAVIQEREAKGSGKGVWAEVVRGIKETKGTGKRAKDHVLHLFGRKRDPKGIHKEGPAEDTSIPDADKKGS